MKTGEEGNKEIDLFQEQLQQELQKIIEEHNLQVNAEIERMQNEKLELQSKLEKEIEELRAKHREEIQKEKEFQKKSLMVSKQASILQIDQLTIPKDEINMVNEYSILIDHITDFNQKLNLVYKRLKHFPEDSQGDTACQQLYTLYKQQRALLRGLVSIMIKLYAEELNDTITNHSIIDETYFRFFRSSLENE